ncbi:MAG: sulfatase, partial [Verrucomicrobiota bacterium]
AGLDLRPQQHLDGVSLVPLFDGEDIPDRDLVWHFPHYQGEGSYPASAVRRGNYKLIKNYHHEDRLLFRVDQDSGEAVDLSASMPQRANEMEEALLRFLTDCRATIPTEKDSLLRE